METGFKIAPHHIDWETMLAAFTMADESGVYAQGWTFDHFYPITGDTSGPCLEGWITLTALAQATENIRLGCLVTGVVYRHPAVLANMASAVDIISNGRLELGLGAGWNEQECQAYGIDLGTLTERFDRFDEAVEIIISLLANPTTSFSGKYFALTDARNEPKGPQQPLPVCIGGFGEKRTLRTVARFADHWNLPFFDAETYANKREVLARHCAEVGRDLETIKTSTHLVVNPDTTPDQVNSQLQEMTTAGLDQAQVYFQPPVDLAQIETITAALV